MFEKKEASIKASKIANFLGVKFKNKDFILKGVASIENLKSFHVSFFTDTINQKFKLKEKKEYNFSKLKKFKNIIIITDKKNEKKINCTKFVTNNPRYDFQRIMNKFFIKKNKNIIHHKAILENKKNIGKNVNIGANSFVEKNVKIGNNTIILNNVVITGKVKIGSNCVIKSNTTIGSEGFGFSYEKKSMSISHMLAE